MRRRDLLIAALASPWLQARGRSASEVLEGVWRDEARDGRALPWRAYLPVAPTTPVSWVIYSHGLGGSRLAGEAWGRHWAAHGIGSLHIQHAGSDRELLAQGGWPQLKAAMSAQQLVQRAKDARFALAEVLRRAAARETPWSALSAQRVGIAGHSFGAVTTQALAGQRYEPDYAESGLQEARLRAALAFSPSLRGGDPARAFAAVTLPFMSITGSEDVTPIVEDVRPEQRVLPFEGMRQASRYLLVFDGAGHASFGGSSEGARLDRHGAATERIRPLIQQATLLFWKAHLDEDGQALAMLRSLRQALPLAAGDVYRTGWEEDAVRAQSGAR